MASKSFKSAARRKTPIKFTLDGDDYEFKPTKADHIALILLEDDDDEHKGASDKAQLRAMFEWLEAGLPAAQYKKLWDRIRDPKDDFGLATLREIVKWLMEENAGRPTG